MKTILHITFSKIAIFSCLLFKSSLLFSTTNTQALTALMDSTVNNTDTIFSNDKIEQKIISFAQDSISYDLENNKVILFGNASVDYSNITLEASYIEINNNDNSVYATYSLDSIGKIVGLPVFSDNGKTFNAKEITYNFTSKKGLIKDIITQEGQGFIHGKKVKKNENDVIYSQKGKYTTCDLDHPHFSIRSNKVKTIPNSKIITGPAMLEFSSVPTPLVLPFGYFPNHDKRSSGLIFPIYGESASQGFFLRNGGYYFAINDYIDLALRGDIYTKGSWGLKLASNYKKRYKYSGKIDLSYARFLTGNEIDNTLSDKRDFFIKWKHIQDPKANPKRKFSANINAGSSSYQKNNSFNDKDYLSNTFQSNLSYSRIFKKSNLTAKIRHSQNTLTKKVDITFPELSYNVSTFYPLKRLNKSSKVKWTDRVKVSYKLNSKNFITTYDSLLFSKNSLYEFQNGIKHNIPISANFKLFKYLNISPSVNYNERWYLNELQKTWKNNQVETDTINSFNRVYDYSLNTSMNTKLYGILNFNNSRLKAIRHIISPSISFRYSPDFSKSSFGYYDNVQSDTTGSIITYSRFQNGIYGTPSANESGIISFSLSNILDMKIIKRDSINSVKKVNLIDNLQINTSYNLFADSLNLSTIRVFGRSKILKNIDMDYGLTYDPYKLNGSGQRVNKFYFNESYLPARLIQARAGFNLRINGSKTSDESDFHWLDYVDFNIPWNFTLNYTINYNKSFVENSLDQSASFSGDFKLTDKWKIGFNSGFDFENQELTYTSLDFYRDLHCWEMRFKWIPFGIRQSYNFTIRVKASVLQDLKWEKKKDWYDY